MLFSHVLKTVFPKQFHLSWSMSGKTPSQHYKITTSKTAR